MARAGRVPEGKPYTAKVILGYLVSWKTVLFTLIFTMQPFGTQPFTAFVFWLKAHNKKGQPPVYTVAQIVSLALALHHQHPSSVSVSALRVSTGTAQCRMD